jgi:cytidylate kinase
MIVTIDGPAGAGKSTVARALAARLGFEYLDTGAMYRAVALAALRKGLDWNQPEQLAEFARGLRMAVADNRIYLGGEDVTDAVRASEVTAVTRYSADNPQVRAHLVAFQQSLARSRNVVTEGRDQGTVAFPGAECKIFLTASTRERARRRLADLEGRGESTTLEQVMAAQEARDRRDASRSVGPLRPAADAIEVSTDGLGIAEVVDRLEEIVRAKM